MKGHTEAQRHGGGDIGLGAKGSSVGTAANAMRLLAAGDAGGPPALLEETAANPPRRICDGQSGG
jgi:hypothetical protein